MVVKSRSLNIAIFHNLPSGGALKMLNEIATRLMQRGHSVSIFLFSTAEQSFIKWPQEIVIHEELLDFKGPLKFKNYFEASKRLAQKINHLDLDFIWVDKCRFMGAPPILRMIHKPYLFYAHEPLRIRAYESVAVTATESINHPKLSLSKLFKKIPRFYDHFKIKNEDRKSIQSSQANIVTNSKYTSIWLEKTYGVKAAVLHPGVNLNFFETNASLQRKHQVLSVGRVCHIKGYDFLLNVLAGIPQEKRPSWQIVCDEIDADFYSSFQKKAKQLGVAYQIHRRTSENELRTFYQESMLTLCASTHEPFGLVPLESFACGTPVLAIAEGGYLETVCHEQAGMVLPRVEEVWSNGIQSGLTDKKRWAQWNFNAVQTAKVWDWELMIDKLEAMIQFHRIDIIKHQ